MRTRNSKRMFDFMYEVDEMALILNTSQDELLDSIRDKSLPDAINSKVFYGGHVFAISKSTYTLILGLKKIGVNDVLQLLKDAHKHKFISELQMDYNRFDLSNYK